MQLPLKPWKMGNTAPERNFKQVRASIQTNNLHTNA